MAQFVITSHYLTSTRGINGGEEMPGTRTTVTVKRWCDAAHVFESEVYTSTASQGLRDTRAGHDAACNAKRATCVPMKPRDYDKVVNIGSIRVRLRRVA